MSAAPSNVAAFQGLVDLASSNVGGQALLCSDDFFAGMENLTVPAAAEFDPKAYTDRGKLMDGWESRRKRVPGHDWCILKLGVPGRIRGVDIDTSFFMGNHPPFASLDAIFAPGARLEDLTDRLVWTEVLAQTSLQRGSHNLAAVASDAVYTHVRLRIFPDGGVARLRVYGDPAPQRGGSSELDLASLANGGRAVACSDMFFSPMNNLLLPGRAADMGGGWETRRSRPPGMDWVIIALGGPGSVARIELDTHHFKGNYPDRAAIDALYWPGAPPASLPGTTEWKEILAPAKLRADHAHVFTIGDPGPWTHLRMRILPDGGVSRLRVWGTRSDTSPAANDPLLGKLAALSEVDLREALFKCCGSRRWVDSMVAERPFASRTALFGTAETTWWALADADWKESFTHHPRIGGSVDAQRERWAAAEQSGVGRADEATLQALAEGNTSYERRFGYTFIVCATGKSASEMLAILDERLESNAPPAELRIAAGEQAKITRLRLEKLA